MLRQIADLADRKRLSRSAIVEAAVASFLSPDGADRREAAFARRLVGELWFDSEEAMTSALNSPEMAAAVEDAKNFLDMNRTGLIIVQEKTVA